ncbi:MAG: BTAD domain-containing putative transcriptional regulator, partial [Acidimicrobiales bacterium]
MPRSFRFEPPEPRPGSLTRPRLPRALLGRWEHRVTSVVGGPGLGKTTLLAQAVAENRLAPRGEDVWIGLEPGDADGVVLARDLMAAVRAEGHDPAAGTTPGTTDEAPDPPTVADAVWRQAPTPLCLVVDDGHWLAPGSPGATWLTALIDALPANGHILLASRRSPAVPLARLATQGAVLGLADDDLRFTDDELAQFAARRGIAVERLDDTGGWPAMAELAASVEHDLAGDYLWEEVIEPLGPERRRVLAVLSDLGGADEGLAGAALGAPVDLAGVLAGVPLVAHGADGWRVP